MYRLVPSTSKIILKLAVLPVSVVLILYAYIYIDTWAMFYLAFIGMNIDNEYLKYTSYLLPALVTSLILAAVFAPLFIYLFNKRAVPAALFVTFPTSLYYLNVSPWPLKWFFFKIESFLLMITFYLVIKLYFAFKHNPHGASE